MGKSILSSLSTMNINQKLMNDDNQSIGWNDFEILDSTWMDFVATTIKNNTGKEIIQEKKTMLRLHN